MPVLSELGRLAERGELEIWEKVILGEYRIRRAACNSMAGEGDYCVESFRAPIQCLLRDGCWHNDPWRVHPSVASNPDDWPGWYDTLAEAVDHLYAALIAAGEV